MNSTKSLYNSTTCLVNNEIVEYDLCVEIIQDLNEKNLVEKYGDYRTKILKSSHIEETRLSLKHYKSAMSTHEFIGIGCIYSINGTIQGWVKHKNGKILPQHQQENTYWFFKKKKNNK